ncbi:MAG: Hpt domain-containing protein [Pseudomonadota bacterium]
MIDWNRIAELKSDLGDDGLADLLPIFLDEIDDALTKLATQTEASEGAAICHFIKGSAANLGFASLAEASHAGEQAGKAGTLPPNIAKTLRDHFDAAKQEFESHEDPSR